MHDLLSHHRNHEAAASLCGRSIEKSLITSLLAEAHAGRCNALSLRLTDREFSCAGHLALRKAGRRRPVLPLERGPRRDVTKVAQWPA